MWGKDGNYDAENNKCGGEERNKREGEGGNKRYHLGVYRQVLRERELRKSVKGVRPSFDEKRASQKAGENEIELRAQRVKARKKPTPKFAHG